MNIDLHAPIGVFDSGVGGLTVAREIMRQMPSENIVYFGDTARVPYGSKSKNTIITFSRQIVQFLKTHQVKAIVVACNTASALALETLTQETDIPVIGVIEPGARAAADATTNHRIGVIATEATINSNLYSKVLHSMCPEVDVFSKACPLFCPLVEEGLLYDSVTIEIAERYLSELTSYDIDTMILGCTHYPLIRHTLQKVVGEHVRLVNPAYETAKSLEKVLKENGLAATPEKPGNHRFFVSDGAEKFKSFASSILPVDQLEISVVNIEAY